MIADGHGKCCLPGKERHPDEEEAEKEHALPMVDEASLIEAMVRSRVVPCVPQRETVLLGVQYVLDIMVDIDEQSHKPSEEHQIEGQDPILVEKEGEHEGEHKMDGGIHMTSLVWVI